MIILFTEVPDPPVEQKPKRFRTIYTPNQLLELESEFSKNAYLPKKRREDLSKTLKLKESKIKIWFQNRRIKSRKAQKQLLQQQFFHPTPQQNNLASNIEQPSTRQINSAPRFTITQQQQYRLNDITNHSNFPSNAVGHSNFSNNALSSPSFSNEAVHYSNFVNNTVSLHKFPEAVVNCLRYSNDAVSHSNFPSNAMNYANVLDDALYHSNFSQNNRNYSMENSNYRVNDSNCSVYNTDYQLNYMQNNNFVGNNWQQQSYNQCQNQYLIQYKNQYHNQHHNPYPNCMYAGRN